MHARISSSSYAALAVVWLCLAAAPWLLPNSYLLNLFITGLINLLLISSLNLLMGYAGQISLAHAAFYGLGAYTSGVLSAKFGVSPWLGMAAAGLLTGVAAAAIGWPALKLRGHYLAMATLGFNAIVSVLFVELYGLTGGPNGLSNVPPLSLPGLSLQTDQSFYYFALVVVGVAMLLLLNLLDSRSGRALRALSSAEVGAACMGVDVHRYKVFVFVLSAMMAALAGCLYVHHNTFVSPESFEFGVSIMLVVMVALGGTGHFWGAFVGALVYTALPELLRAFGDFELLIYGLALVLVLLFFPRGAGGVIDWLVTRRSRAAAPSGAAARAAQ
ncbi:MAG: branched-chain amino acid ABC transporter permease [Burkholderiaceae bacterium]